MPAEIQNGVSSYCAINVDVISETYEDYSNEKTANSSSLTTQLRFDDALQRNALEYPEIIYITRN